MSVEAFSRQEARAANAEAVWTQRSGLVLQLFARGARGRGEVSPLPGYSPDTLEEAEAELQTLDPRGLGLDPEGSIADLRVTELRSPALRFALESALLDLGGRLAQRPGWSFLTSAPFEVEVAEALTALERARADAERWVQAGFRCLKLKVGRAGRLEEELSLIRELRDRYPEVELRVDANRSLSIDPEASIERLAEAGADWIEEPTPSPRAWPVGQPGRLVLALDESLLGWPPGQFPPGGHRADVLVLKPALLGGLRAVLGWAAAAQAAGQGAVISHLFDGPVAAAAYRTVAVALGGPRAHGLGLRRGGGPRLAPPAEPGLGTDGGGW
jgi:o-succinylbenzoate synthase